MSCSADTKYEVIENRTGAVLAVFDNPDDADNYAISHGVILRLISKANLEKLRNGEFA